MKSHRKEVLEMKEYQEALNYLKGGNMFGELSNEVLESIEVLIDKETPMKPILRKFINRYDCEDYEYLCGKCKVHLLYHHRGRVDRCNDNECNQLVDWSDEE